MTADYQKLYRTTVQWDVVLVAQRQKGLRQISYQAQCFVLRQKQWTAVTVFTDVGDAKGDEIQSEK
jgi:hypothetical protein